MSDIDIIDWLRERAFGGREAVAVPRGTPLGGPRGPFPAGVQDLVDFLADSHSAAEAPGAEQWGFLVGAPGNGKSEAMRSLANRLGIAPPAAGETAPRTLDGETAAGASVVLINDASIPRPHVDGAGSLALDLSEALAEVGNGGRLLLFANVNRGILVEERNKARKDDEGGVVTELLEWLNEAAAGNGPDDPATSYYARRRVETGGRHVVLHVLSLDALSLFEPQPAIGSSRVSLDFSMGDDPAVAPYQPVGGLHVSKRSRQSAAASVLTKDVADPARWDGQGCGGCAASPLCPFKANAAWLGDGDLRDGFLDVMRSAEVAAGRRMTYRDLLATLATAIIGPNVEAWDSGVHPCDWAGDLAASGTDAAIGTLARHRIHAAMFPPPDPPSWRRLGKGAIRGGSLYHAVLADFGPARAGERPGQFALALRTLDPAASVDEWGGLRAATLDEAEAMHVQQPLATLAPMLPAAATCELDHRLDQVVLAHLQGEAEESTAGQQRSPQVRKWRSMTLLRQVGLAGGWIADFEAVDAWLVAQEGTLSRGAAGDLLSGLRRMLVPEGGTLYLAPFRPRTRSFETSLPARTVLISRQTSELSVELRASRDSLQFFLRLSGGGQGEGLLVPVDLDLTREALVVTRSRQGFTDLPDQAIARVERVLASLIARKRQTGQPHVTDAEGRLFRIRGGWGAHTLGVERR